mgnify:FL=1
MNKQKNFEQSLAALEAIVNKMEKGELDLEASLKEYESGMALVQTCQKTLSEAEQRIKIIAEKNGTITENPFDE